MAAQLSIQTLGRLAEATWAKYASRLFEQAALPLYTLSPGWSRSGRGRVEDGWRYRLRARVSASASEGTSAVCDIMTGPDEREIFRVEVYLESSREEVLSAIIISPRELGSAMLVSPDKEVRELGIVLLGRGAKNASDNDTRGKLRLPLPKAMTPPSS